MSKIDDAIELYRKKILKRRTDAETSKGHE